MPFRETRCLICGRRDHSSASCTSPMAAAITRATVLAPVGHRSTSRSGPSQQAEAADTAPGRPAGEG